MFLPKKHADLPIEPSVLESLRAQEKSLKREKRKAAKERRQHAKQLKKDEKHAKKRIAARKVPQKASDCLQYLSMSQDGICEVEPGLFSMTMAFTDVNFQIAMLEEQKNIFTKYSEFLNYFDPSLHLEINLVTRSMDEEQFRRDTFLPLRGNDRDRYAEEMNQVVAEKALRGQNGLIREKYVTFSLHAENYQQAKEQLENRAADIADHFTRMGSNTRILSGIERLSLLQGIMRPNEEMNFSYDWLLAEDDLTTKDFISPSSYNWHPEHDDSRAVYRDRYRFGDKIGKTMYLRGIAPEMKNCICFNTVKLGKSMQSIGMLTVLDQVWNRITRNRVLGRRTWVFTDEFQQLLGNKDCTDFYFQLSSRARKWGAILTSITQHVRSVLDNEDARRMLSDCGYIKLLNQSPDDANDLARLLHISNEEKRYIENAEVGSGLLIVSKTVVPFNNDFPKDTELFRLMDTSPNRKP